MKAFLDNVNVLRVELEDEEVKQFERIKTAYGVEASATFEMIVKEGMDELLGDVQEAEAHDEAESEKAEVGGSGGGAEAS